MDRVFIAHRFDELDRALASEVEDLLTSYELHATTGRLLGGDDLDDTVKKKIDEADAVIALMTRRDKLAEGEVWVTHPWVVNEYDYAVAKNKRAIAVVESGVRWTGMHGGREHIQFDRDQQNAALLRLSKTVAKWKSDAGRRMKIQIVSKTLKLSEAGYNYEYRFRQDGDAKPWQAGKAQEESGGVFVYIDGVSSDRVLLQIRVIDARTGQVWTSAATP